MKGILAILMAGMMVLAIAVPMAMGANEVTQEATVTKVTTLEINNQANDAAITTISFSGASGATDSAPFNNVDTASPQNITAGTPVAVIDNSGTVALKVHLTADGDAGFKALVSAERAELADPIVGPLIDDLTFGVQVVATGAAIAGGASEELFLEADLQGSGSSAGGSLTVEGEA